jgi:DNA polymerase III subunit delta
MQLPLGQLAAHVEKRKFAPLYLLHGDEPLLQIEATDALRGAAVSAGYGEREVWTIDQHFKWAEAMATQDNMSLFASQKITEIRVPTGRVGVEGGEAMRQLAMNANDNDVIIANFPKLDKTQQNSAWFTEWAQRGIVIETPPVEREQMAGWLAGRLKQQNQTADADALAFLVDHCEGNLVAAMQEVKKLALVCPQPALTRADVEDAVVNVARYTIEQLSESFLRGDVDRFTVVLNGLREEGEALPPIIWKLSDVTHQLARTMTFLRSGVPTAQALRNARVWGKTVAAIEAACKSVDPRAIAPLIHKFAELDAASKGLRPQLNVWSELPRCALKLHLKVNQK